MKGVTLVFILVFSIPAINGDQILRGFMISKDAKTCIDTGDASAVAPLDGSTMDPAGLEASGCTLMSVKDGASGGQYIIEEQGDSTKQMTLNIDASTTFTETGTQITFTADGTTVALDGITSANVVPITMATGVYVANEADEVDNTDCLKLDGTYHQGTVDTDCNDQLWYFVPAACTASQCVACNPDPAFCSECAPDRTLTKDRTMCQECYVEKCERCEEPSVCVACSNDLFPNGTHCAACGSVIPDCEECVVIDGVTTCEDCFESAIPHPNGSKCEACSYFIPDCEACIITDGDIICSACRGGSTCEMGGAASIKAPFMAIIGFASMLLAIF